MTKRKPPNWATRLAVTKSTASTYWNERTIKFNLVFDKKPKGFNKLQGHLILNQSSPHLVQVARVSRHFHHNNLGYTLYTHALNELGELSTNYNRASKQAQKLWRRLMNDFEHRIGHNGRLTVYNRRIRTRKRK